MPILNTPEDFAQVRAAIDTDLTEEDVSDDLIGGPIYAQQAEREIRGVLGEKADDPANEESVRVAVIFRTAALLAPAVPIITSERLGDQTYARASVDVSKLAKDLKERSEKILDPLTPAPERSGAASRPRMFALARGRRGR